MDEQEKEDIISGATSSYNGLLNKYDNGGLTPNQFALECAFIWIEAAQKTR